MKLGAMAWLSLVALVGGAAAQMQTFPDGVGGGQMPEDHPSWEQLLEAGPTGTLAISAIQGTPGGPSVGEADVTVTLFVGQQQVKEMAAHLDDQGRTVLEQVPIGIEVTPVASIEYLGLTYSAVGDAMSEESPDGSVELIVYETTDQRPDLRIKMRHTMISPGQGHTYVRETVVVENPGQRTYLGGEPDETGQRTSVQLLLPEGAHDIELIQGFHGWCCTKYEGRTLSVQMPLTPGQKQLQLGYALPPAGGGATPVLVGASAPAEMVLFLVPEDGSGVEEEGVQFSRSQSMGQVTYRMYQGSGLAAGQSVGVRIVPAAGAEQAAPAPSQTGGAMWVAVLGGGVVVLGGLVILLARLAIGSGSKAD